METIGLGLHFEDLPVGRRFRTIGRTVTEADVNCTGMVEVLFTNTEFLREESDIKQRLAPAALSYCFAEGLLVQATMQHTGFAFLHMELNVEQPVFAGDTIHVACEVTEARLSRNRPGRGLVRTRNQVVKQDGTVALTYTPLYSSAPHWCQIGIFPSPNRHGRHDMRAVCCFAAPPTRAQSIVRQHVP
jgi:acyl dehydratase